MDNKKLEFYAVAIVLFAFCGCSIGLVVACCMSIKIDPAVPLVDGTLGTLAMAMWKDFSHSNQDRDDNKPPKTLEVKP